MSCLNPFLADSPVHRLDARMRVAGAAGFALVAAFCRHPAPLALGAGLALALGAAAHLPWKVVLRRLAVVNAFLLVLVVLLPPAVPGRTVFAIGPLAYSAPGLARAGSILLRANAIVLAFTALVSTMEAVTLGRALAGLRLPGRLVHLLLFTVRYVEVLHREYRRLRTAMRMRGFRPRVSLHTFRSFGFLVGMLLVRSLERAERILQAMKCRGFRGHLWIAPPEETGQGDRMFAALLAVACAAMLWLEVA